MNRTDIESLFDKLKASLAHLINENNLAGDNIAVHCRVLEAAEAIGNPEHDDYPILSGREHMIEATFRGSRGQAFGDEFTNHEGPIDSLLTMKLDTNARRAVFVASLNAVYRYCGICDKTVHCKDDEPLECAKNLHEIFPASDKVLLVGLQPRFLEELAKTNRVRTVDLDPKNIGDMRHGVRVEHVDATPDACEWCDSILITGSTLVNGSISNFIHLDKHVVFFGVTISAAAEILGLETFCHAPVR